MAIGGAQPGNVSLRWMRFGSPWRIETKIPYFKVGTLEGGELVRTLDVTLAPHKPVFGRFPVLFTPPRCDADIVTSY